MTTTTTTRSPIAPDRTLAQRMKALEKGNAIRSERCRLKLDLKAGRIDPIDIVRNPPEWAETMKVMDLLLAIPKIGQVKMRKALAVTRVSSSKTLGGLTWRQRDELVAALDARTAR